MRGVCLAIVLVLTAAGGQFIFHIPPAGSGSGPTPCTPNVANLTVSTIQSAVDAASSGATICLPSGTATWSSTITLSGKALVFQGQTSCSGAGSSLACTDTTNITCSAKCLAITSSATNFVVISGISFTITGGDANTGAITMDGSGFQVTFRMHHVHYTQTSCGGSVNGCTGGIVSYDNYGLYDHMLVSTNAHAWGLLGEFGNAGFGSWQRAMDWGTNAAIYIEDSKITINGASDGLMDGFAGGRFVFRYNDVTASGSMSGADVLGTHGTDSGSRLSWLKSEVYNNTFTNNSNGTVTFFRMRGGSGVFYNNTFGGSQGWNGVHLQLYRGNSTCNTGGSFPLCDGTNYKATPTGGPPSNEWSASAGGTYNFCAINRSTYCTVNATCDAITGGDTCTTFWDGSGTSGYACRGQPGRGTNETLEPIYEWNNGSIGVFDDCDDGNQVQENRDYYNDTTKPGYTGYTHPHPLQSGS